MINKHGLHMKSERDVIYRKVTYERAFNLILEFFNNDKDKGIRWYMTKNPLLGNMTPFEMVKQGRVRKLLQFIEASLAENY